MECGQATPPLAGFGSSQVLFRDWTPSLQFTVQYPHGDQRPQWPSILTKKHQNWTGSYVLMLVFKCIRGLKINFPPCLTWTFAGIAFNVVILNAICIRFATTGLRWTAVAIPLSFFITVTITGTKRTPACPRIVCCCCKIEENNNSR